MKREKRFEKAESDKHHRDKPCCPCGKCCYRTKAVCIQEMSRLHHAYGDKYDTMADRAYKCRLCRYWHATKQPPR